MAVPPSADEAIEQLRASPTGETLAGLVRQEREDRELFLRQFLELIGNQVEDLTLAKAEQNAFVTSDVYNADAQGLAVIVPQSAPRAFSANGFGHTFGVLDRIQPEDCVGDNEDPKYHFQEYEGPFVLAHHTHSQKVPDMIDGNFLVLSALSPATRIEDAPEREWQYLANTPRIFIACAPVESVDGHELYCEGAESNYGTVSFTFSFEDLVASAFPGGHELRVLGTRDYGCERCLGILVCRQGQGNLFPEADLIGLCHVGDSMINVRSGSLTAKKKRFWRNPAISSYETVDFIVCANEVRIPVDRVTVTFPAHNNNKCTSMRREGGCEDEGADEDLRLQLGEAGFELQ